MMCHLKKILFVLLFTISGADLIAQHLIKITKVSSDSFDISIPDSKDLYMQKKYKFKIETNITESDRIYSNLNNKIIKNGLIINKVFDYHELEFILLRKDVNNSMKLLQVYTTPIKGTRFEIKTNNNLAIRSKGATIRPNDILEIELLSDIYNFNDLEILEPIYIYWTGNKAVKLQYTVTSSYIQIKMSELKSFIKAGLATSSKYNYIAIQYPQVYFKQKELLSKDIGSRNLLFRFDNNSD